MGLLKKGIIVDATAFQVFVKIEHEDAEPIHRCLLNQKIYLVHGNDEKSLEEFKKYPSMFDMIRKLKRAVYQVSSKEKKKEIDENNRFVNNVQMKSKDTHIIAVALSEEKARILFSKGDDKLIKDFTNIDIVKPKGKIYKNKDHKHLLLND